MRHLRKTVITTVVLISLHIAVTAQTGSKPITDGTTAWAKLVLTALGDGSAVNKRNIKPFVIGYCGWRTNRMAQFPLTQFEGRQVKICEFALNPFDTAISTEIDAIYGRAEVSRTADGIDATDAEKLSIKNFVALKYGFYYKVEKNKFSKNDAVAAWKFDVAGVLGEIGSDITFWWRLPSSVSTDRSIADRIDGLSKLIPTAPVGTDPKFVADLKALAALGKLTRFAAADRERVRDFHAQVLVSSLTLIKLANQNERDDAVPLTIEDILRKA